MPAVPCCFADRELKVEAMYCKGTGQGKVIPVFNYVIKHFTLKACWKVQVCLPFMTSTLGADEWQLHSPVPIA
jgi:hypothetical protein